MSSIDENDAFEAAVPLSQRAVAARPAPYLDELNPAQREAVEALDGPVLMLAGAGTGKTKALTARIAHLLNTGKVRPNEILAVTFTNKAAREMKNRVGNYLGETVEGMPWLGTFHAICVKLLRRHAELIGTGGDVAARNDVIESDEGDPYDLGPVPRPQTEDPLRAEHTRHLKSNFTILDTDDQIRLLKQLIQAANIDDKRWPARQLAAIIDNWKNRAWTPETLPAGEASAFNGKGPELYAEYQNRLITLNAVDFGDLLLHVVTIFQNHPDILAKYQSWFRYILVDEYQDTNVAQYLWLRLLAGAHKNICCVGDDDQSIYGWRGAEVGNILRFEKDFPGAKVIRLEQNYRSTPHILAAASGVIRGNEGRLGKELWTEAEDGEKLRLIGHWDGEEEARWIGDEVEALQSGTRGMDAKNLNEMAILVRASHQMRAFEDRFLTIGLPYRVIGGPRFYERMEIRDAMAYFRVSVSLDDDLAFERIVNTPKRGVGDKGLQTIQIAARSNGISLVEATRLLLSTGDIKGKAKGELGALVGSFDRWNWLVLERGNESEIGRLGEEADDATSKARTLASELEDNFGTSDLDEYLTRFEQPDAEPPEEETLNLFHALNALRAKADRLKLYQEILQGNHILLAETILEESGYTEMWQNDKTPEAPGRLENLKELVKALEQFENLQGFLEHIALIMDNDSEEAEDKLTIMTLHAAKGLEYPVIFLPGWEDGLFPSQRSMDESGIKGLEEERRLAYVGITRAEELCTISFAGNRRVYGQWQSQLPSRFIDELPEEHVDVLTPPGLYGGGYGAAASPSAAMEDRATRADAYNSPGWKRMQARAAQRPMSQPREASNMVIDSTAISSHTVGDRVFHTKFGYGEVMGIEGDKLEIEFDKAGTKKVVAKFIVAAASAGDVPF